MLARMTCALCRRNGQRGYCAESAAAFMNLSLREYVFVNARTTAVGMGTVTFASSLARPVFSNYPSHSSWRLRAEVYVNLRKQSGNVASVPAITIISIDSVEGECASERSS
jgi:hypothetical protein